MLRLGSFGFGLLVAIGSLLIACEPEASSGTISADALSASSCSDQDHKSGLARYETAVALAKAHLQGKGCEDATLAEILATSAASVGHCEDFTKQIAEDQSAKPIRDVLAGNLGLAALTGKLRVVENGQATWRGLADALPGTTLFATTGAVGNTSEITFAADGKATLAIRVEGKILLSKSLEWKLDAIDAKGSIGVIFNGDGDSSKYLLQQDDLGTGLDNMPAFKLVPTAQGNEFSSVPSECES